MDVVQEIFKAIHFDANIYLHSEFCAPWGVSPEPTNNSSFHVIAYGNCQLQMDHLQPIHLNAGDLIFFPRNCPHQLISPESNNESSTTLICGQLTFSHINNPILDALPDVLHIKANEMEHCRGFKGLFQQIVTEAENQDDGRQLVLDKLAEVMFIYIIRYHITSAQDSHVYKTGLLYGLSHPQLAHALVAFHAAPDYAWSLAELANKAAMSRSKFAALFSKMVGMTALQYMTHWRMEHARHLLISENTSVWQVALSSGYQSEAAFIKVFKKQYGMTPGQFRKQAS